jgi:hypothetical protein
LIILVVRIKLVAEYGTVRELRGRRKPTGESRDQATASENFKCVAVAVFFGEFNQ